MARKPKENKAIPGQIGGGHRRITYVTDITEMKGSGGTLKSVTKANTGGSREPVKRQIRLPGLASRVKGLFVAVPQIEPI